MLIKTKTSAIACGTISNLKSRTVKNDKLMVTFGIRCDEETDDLGNTKPKYMNCIAFGAVAEYIDGVNENSEHVILHVDGKLQENEYNGKTTEQILVEYASEQPKVKTARKSKPNLQSFDSDDDMPF